MKKVLGEFVLALFLMFIASFVIAWGYQVFWNEVVLNICQMFNTGDVFTTMRIPYGACLAIAFGISLVNSKKEEVKAETVSEMVSFVMTKSLTKLIMICITLLVTSIVFC
jgi:hypothetical protein